MVSSSGAMRMPCWREHVQSYLRFCPILRIEGSSSSGFSSASASRSGTCVQHRRRRSRSCRSRRAMAERHVAGLARRDRQREADELGLHRVERSSSRCRRRRGRRRERPRSRPRGASAVVTVSYLERSNGALAACGGMHRRGACGVRPRRRGPAPAPAAAARLRALRGTVAPTDGLDRRPAARRRGPRRCAWSAW